LLGDRLRPPTSLEDLTDLFIDGSIGLRNVKNDGGARGATGEEMGGDGACFIESRGFGEDVGGCVDWKKRRSLGKSLVRTCLFQLTTNR
jgi:hypothetical protein